MSLKENFTKGKAAYNKEDYEKAISYFDQVLDIFDEHVESLELRAISLVKTNQFQQAIADYSKLIEMHPLEATYFSDRGVTLHKAGLHQQAIEDFRQASSLEPQNGYHYACIAYVSDKTGSSELAIQFYKKALEVDPKDEISANNLEMAKEKMQYQEKNKSRINKPGYFTDKELKNYSKEFQVRQKEKPHHSALPESQNSLWKEVKKVFSQKDSFIGFLKFLSRGFK